MSSDPILSGSLTPVIVLTEESLSLNYSPKYCRWNDNGNLTTTMTPDKRSSSSIYCRICHEDSSLEELIDPCECSGTLALIHTSCLEKWLSTSNTEHCEICQHAFSIQRKNKSIFKSLRMWWKNKNAHGARGIAGDALSLTVLTPLCIAATYLCGIGASTYSKLGFWEGTGLAILCCLLLATYCLWFFVTIRFHYNSWQEWRGRNQDIKLLVKHRKDEEKQNGRLLVGKSLARNLADRNNNRSVLRVMRPRESGFASWFGINFTGSNDPLFVLQQTTFV